MLNIVLRPRSSCLVRTVLKLAARLSNDQCLLSEGHVYLHHCWKRQVDLTTSCC